MKKILCYGDSNTFGYNPKDGSRFDEKTRWATLLGNALGSNYEITEEGVCDRTGFADNDKGFLYSSQRHFPKFISKIKNIDLLILWIGTNDLQFKYNLTTGQIENGLEKLINTAKNYSRRILLIPPVILSDNVLERYFGFQFDSSGISKSKHIGKIYRKLSKVYNLDFFDVNKFIKPSSFDGLHYDETGHKIISEKISDYILQNNL